MSTKFKKLFFVLVMLAFLVAGLCMSAFVSNADTYYTIKISYFFKDGTPAHDSYIAAFPAGKTVDLTVTNPNITGFTPMTSTEGGDAAISTKLEYEHLNSNVNISVYYIAGLTKYRAMYYKQNIYDDLYTRDNTLPSTLTDRYGYTGTNPTDLEDIQFEGFTNLFHEPDAIAADGSTVFRVYYDRNYYTVNFDLGEGGYGIDDVYAKYQSVYHIGEPKREGYSFVGWVKTNADSSKYYDKNNVEITDAIDSAAFRAKAFKFYDGEISSEDVYYMAVWEPGITKYSIVYWMEKPDSTLTPEIMEAQTTSEDLRQLVTANYYVVAAKDFENVPSNTMVNYEAMIRDYDFFYSNVSNKKNRDLSTYFTVTDSETGEVRPAMSNAQLADLNGKGRFFELNTFLTKKNFYDNLVVKGELPDKPIAGDGTTRINVYYDRKSFDLKFFFARQGYTNGELDPNKISLTNSTKEFSKCDYKKTDDSEKGYLYAVSKGPWKDNCADTLPQLRTKYTDPDSPDYIPGLEVKYEDYVTPENGYKYRYYYYQFSSHYNGSLKNKWLIDALTDVHRKNGGAIEMCKAGSIAVEYYTNFRDSHKGVGNYTVKGFYERLGMELMFKDAKYDTDELHYLISWTNTDTGNGWNGPISRVLNFRYENYTELLPKEVVMADAEGAEAVETAYGYTDVRQFTTVSNGESVTKWYGLKSEQIFNTIDSGNQYERSYSDEKKNLAVRLNQVSAEISGYKLENYRLYDNEDVNGDGKINSDDTKYNGQIVLNDTNTEIDWSEDTDNDRHATVRFFYRRLVYTLQFRNGNNLDKVFNQDEGNGVAYGVSLNKKYASGENAGEYIYYYEPVYYNPDLRDYYEFEGWYYTPYYYRKVDFNTEKMPADDLTLYAHWIPKKIKIYFYDTYNDFYESTHDENVEKRIPCKLNPDYDAENPGDTAKWIDTDIIADYGSYIPSNYIPANIADGSGNRPALTPPALGAQFAGWYYLRDNIPTRFEPENIKVTALNREAAEEGNLKLYAEWVTKDVAKFKVNYVEDGNHDREVADSTTGRAFVYKTKTFNAKCGEELNNTHEWIEDGVNWWPTINSHSLVIKSNEQGKVYAPNEWTFYYIQKQSVHYTIQYLDAVSRTPLLDEEHHVSTHASIEVDAPFIPGYTASEGIKTLVLSASTASTVQAQTEEELAANVITFYYNKNDTEYVYDVEYYVQNIDDDGYTLNQKEHLAVSIVSEGDTTVSITDIYGRHIPAVLVNNGFTRKLGATTVVETNGSVNTYTIADNANIVFAEGHRTRIKIYFDRNSYPYSYQYVDYKQEQAYNAALENHQDVSQMWNGVISEFNNQGPERVDKDVVIRADEDVTYNGIPYTRIHNKDITLNIAPPSVQNPNVNSVKIYYKKFTERELMFKLACANESSPYTEVDYNETTGDPLYGGISLPMQTVDSYDSIQPVIFYNFNEALVTGEGGVEDYVHHHKYTFLGWYDNPNGEGEPLTTNETLTKEDLNLNNSLPARDKTYYAVVEQVLVSAKFEFRYVEENLPVDDAEATAVVAAAPVDENGDRTGGRFDFSAPSTYENNTPIPWHRTDGYSMSIEPKDDKVYKYEFAEWWEVDLKNGNSLIRHHNWNSNQEGWASTSLYNQVTRNDNKYIVAVYKRRTDVTSLPYTIKYRFNTRTNGEKDYVIKGTLSGEELIEGNENCKINDLGYYALSDEFILKNAPYEENHGETLIWSDDFIESGSVKGDSSQGTSDRLVSTITAVQSTRKAMVYYKLNPDDTFHSTESKIGANRNTDEGIAAIVAPEYYNGKHFSYWAVRKGADRSSKMVAKCFEMEFSLCIMDNYYITPVFNSRCENCIVFSTLEDDQMSFDDGYQWVAFTWRENHIDDQVKYPSEDMVFCGLQDYVEFVRVRIPDDAPEDYELTPFDYRYVNSKTHEIGVINGMTYVVTGYEDTEKTTILGHYKSLVTLEHLDYTRNRWTDEEGVVANTGETDILYTDFEVSFADSVAQIRDKESCRVGIVYEFCATLKDKEGNVIPFNPDHDYNAATDFDNLKEAIDNNATQYCYKGTKKRSIYINHFSMSDLTNKNRINAYLGMYNNLTTAKLNQNWLIKATAYFVDGNGNYSFSNSVYTNLYSISQRFKAQTESQD